ncbi:Maf family protein [Dinghuibacter silviterrae]|uniref:dTTP/UTP pyrophosphatase n=1 Tax=Dinghuibacter silviterrae TaxID=1539049 RepID=A0A4R8DV44_9BACT|nr:Maf family protein [Dinghuibacter silviterrae]TDX01788.1 septum formation protein [Dinghuibacter silviterrae]
MLEPIILASQSPRRRQLLEWAEVAFDVVVPSTDESYPSGMAASEVPVFIARQKALAVQSFLTSSSTPLPFDGLATERSAFLAGIRKRIVMAADTVVVLGEEIIGKPRDRDDAIAILMRLSGQEHRVITGVCCRRGDRELSFSDTTRVLFHPLTEAQIAFYVDKYRPYDKAGAYAIQEWIGVVGIKSVDGDFYNVMGLPVSRVVRTLSAL